MRRREQDAVTAIIITFVLGVLFLSVVVTYWQQVVQWVLFGALVIALGFTLWALAKLSRWL